MNYMKHVMSVLLMVCLCFALPSAGFALTNQKHQTTGAVKAVININTADVTALDGLPRVGPKMAARIIEYRKSNGNFKRIQDLMKVKGIGPKVFEKLKDQIAV